MVEKLLEVGYGFESSGGNPETDRAVKIRGIEET